MVLVGNHPYFWFMMFFSCLAITLFYSLFFTLSSGYRQVLFLTFFVECSFLNQNRLKNCKKSGDFGASLVIFLKKVGRFWVKMTFFRDCEAKIEVFRNGYCFC